MPFANRTEARDAVSLLVRTAWEAQTPPVPVLLYDDVKGDKPGGLVPWARLQMRHGPSTQVTIGSPGQKRFRRTGVVTIQIFTPVGEGLTRSDVFADAAADAMEGKSTGGDEMEFRNVSAPEIGPDGDWFQTNVIADFEYDIVK